MRNVLLLFSVPFLGQYLNLIKDVKQNEPLWWNLKQSNIKGQLEYGGLLKMLKEVANAAGIEKRRYPHLFRHSRASDYANRLTEQQLKAFFGWTGSSTMVSTYVHFSGRDIDNAVLQANGMETNDKIAESVLKARECPKCKTPNGMGSSYRTRCGSVLDIQTALNEEEHTDKLVKLFVKGLKDPEAAEQVSQFLAKR